MGWVAPLTLVMVGLFVTNLTVMRRPPNPFPLVAAGAHLLALITIIGRWKRQHPVSRVMCALVFLPAAILLVGNLADGASRFFR